jgi:hypothetical protein
MTVGNVGERAHHGGDDGGFHVGRGKEMRDAGSAAGESGGSDAGGVDSGKSAQDVQRDEILAKNLSGQGRPGQRRGLGDPVFVLACGDFVAS